VRTAALLLSLLAISASIALAATTWKTGQYAGKTDGNYCVHHDAHGKCTKFRKGRISFHVGKDSVGAASGGGQIRFEVREKCQDGTFGNWAVVISGEVPLNGHGRFTYVVDTAGKTGKDRISGRVSGSEATGKLRRTDKEDATGNEDPNGVACDSGWVHWEAHRVKKH
jgi:hypothetical protein